MTLWVFHTSWHSQNERTCKCSYPYSIWWHGRNCVHRYIFKIRNWIRSFFFALNSTSLLWLMIYFVFEYQFHLQNFFFMHIIPVTHTNTHSHTVRNRHFFSTIERYDGNYTTQTGHILSAINVRLTVPFIYATTAYEWLKCLNLYSPNRMKI